MRKMEEKTVYVCARCGMDAHSHGIDECESVLANALNVIINAIFCKLSFHFHAHMLDIDAEGW